MWIFFLIMINLSWTLLSVCSCHNLICSGDVFVGRRGKDRNEFRMIMYGHYIVKAVFLQLIEDYHINRHRTEACTVLLILCIDAFRVVMHHQPATSPATWLQSSIVYNYYPVKRESKLYEINLKLPTLSIEDSYILPCPCQFSDG